MGIGAVICAWLGLTVARADSVAPPPPPVAAQGFSLDSAGNVTVTRTDGTAQTIAMGSVLQVASQTPQIVNNAILAAINALNLPGTYTNAAQAAAAAPVQSVNGKTGSVALAAGDVGAIGNTVAAIVAVLGYTPYSAANPAGYQTTAQVTAAITAAGLSIPGGPFTIATLPACNASTAGKIAFVSDLGGGADNVVCKGSPLTWGNIRLGTPALISTCGNIVITPLVSAPVEQFTCTAFGAGSSINIIASNLYTGEEFYLTAPSTLGALVGTLGVNLGGIPTGLSLTAGQKVHYIVTAAGGLLPLQN